jgi:hypothetical protein
VGEPEPEASGKSDHQRHLLKRSAASPDFIYFTELSHKEEASRARWHFPDADRHESHLSLLFRLLNRIH